MKSFFIGDITFCPLSVHGILDRRTCCPTRSDCMVHKRGEKTKQKYNIETGEYWPFRMCSPDDMITRTEGERYWTSAAELFAVVGCRRFKNTYRVGRRNTKLSHTQSYGVFGVRVLFKHGRAASPLPPYPLPSSNFLFFWHPPDRTPKYYYTRTIAIDRCRLTNI